MKFKVGQEVMIISGCRYGKKGRIANYEGGVYNWYHVMIDGQKESIGYAECELESIQ